MPDCDLRGHLEDSVVGKTLPDFPYRWGVLIRVDMSSLEVGQSSTTDYKGGHSIDITTDPDETPTVT